MRRYLITNSMQSAFPTRQKWDWNYYQDVRALARLINEQDTNCRVDVSIAKKINAEKRFRMLDPAFNPVSIEDEDWSLYDRVFVIPSNLNYFAGHANYRMCRYLKNIPKVDEVVMVPTDPKMLFDDPWFTWVNAGRSESYFEDTVGMTKAEIRKLRDYPSNIKFASHFFSLRKIYDRNRAVRWTRISEKAIDEVKYINLNRHWYTDRPAQIEPNQSDIDCQYVGTDRTGYRSKRVKSFFESPEISSVTNCMILKGVEKHENRDPVRSDQLHAEMQARSTIVVGDEPHENNTWTPRVFQSMGYGCVSFIDERFDPSHRIINDAELAKWLYVKDPAEFVDRVKSIRVDQSLRNDIYAAQISQFNEMVAGRGPFPDARIVI